MTSIILIQASKTTKSEYKKILKKFYNKKNYVQKLVIANSVIFFCELKK